jgi:uncharacterized membrane protein YoaK (UPF0700 family)
MTGTTTQIMIDIADLVRVHLPTEDRTAAVRRARSLATAMAGFGAGAASAALPFSKWTCWCFAIPPVIALAARLVLSRDPPAVTRSEQRSP